MSDANKNVEKPSLSDREAELLVYAMRCCEGGFPKVDWAKFAEMAGYKNAASASVSFGSVKKKVMGDIKTTPKKATPSKRKQPTFAGAKGEDTEESPAKKSKATPKKPGKKEQTKIESDDDDHTAFV